MADVVNCWEGQKLAIELGLVDCPIFPVWIEVSFLPGYYKIDERPVLPEELQTDEGRKAFSDAVRKYQEGANHGS